MSLESAGATERTVICTVTHNDETELDGFVQAIEALGEPRPHCIVVDCGSSDDSAARARARAIDRRWLRSVALDENLGFAGGINRAIAQARDFEPAWIWSLNADTRPQPDALVALLEAAQRLPQDGHIGAVTPRILRSGTPSPRTDPSPQLDACGMALTRSWRHLDRGSEEIDRGQYACLEEVFGGTGAATLYRLAALDDVAFPAGQPFDELFHSYREDAEVAFRLQRRGWRTLYQPDSIVQHRRAVTPARRTSVSAAINRRSLQNRYLLRIYHQTLGNALGLGLPAAGRDVAILLYVLMRERSSLPAYSWLWHNRRVLWQRRSWLKRRDLGHRRQLARWFRHSSRPLALPTQAASS